MRGGARFYDNSSTATLTASRAPKSIRLMRSNVEEMDIEPRYSSGTDPIRSAWPRWWKLVMIGLACRSDNFDRYRNKL
jgi:hypothetical protein